MPIAKVGPRAVLGLTLLALGLAAPVAAHAQAGKTSPGERLK